MMSKHDAAGAEELLCVWWDYFRPPADISAWRDNERVRRIT